MDDHGITVVLGHSGCGKTTLLRLVAGLEQADSGTVDRSPKIGVIFQEPRLMPWLNIGNNILFGTGRKLRRKGPLDHDLERLLELTRLKGFERAYPSQLSGGMQQRAALARALAYEPDYLLMDEPFAALDYFTRKEMQQELLRIQGTEKKGILFVTHSIDEALAIGKKVVILEQGICRKEYNLDEFPYPRDLLGEELSEIKKNIIAEIEEGWEKRNENGKKYEKKRNGMGSIIGNGHCAFGGMCRE